MVIHLHCVAFWDLFVICCSYYLLLVVLLSVGSPIPRLLVPGCCTENRNRPPESARAVYVCPHRVFHLLNRNVSVASQLLHLCCIEVCCSFSVSGGEGMVLSVDIGCESN